jgi:hypothetical protein
MECPDITTLERAEAKLSSSVLPIGGLRRGDDGILTEDARNMVMDGLKSRGIDLSNKEQKTKIISELGILLCSVNKQYEFLLKELHTKINSTEDISDKFIHTIRDKNIFMLDIITISRHIKQKPVYDGTVPFIEGWQNGSTTESFPDNNALSQQLAKDRTMLDSHSYEELRKHSVQITMEKNKVASNYLGIYGFLNLIAVGLILYVAGITK